MKTLLIHLSDIHIKNQDDCILGRAKEIADAVQTMAADVDLAVFVTTGDIAYSGTAEQYLLAQRMFSTISQSFSRSMVERGRTIPVHHAIVPGNHDCNFTDVPMVRQLIIEAILKDPKKASDSSVAQICTGVQDEFFSFLDSATSDKRKPLLPYPASRLCYEYTFEASGESLRIICYNTAFVSQMHERQGSLVLPTIPIPDSADENVTIAAFHHPYNWLESNVARAFRKSIENKVDIVLTGHEHDPDMTVREHSGGSINTYIEGGLLQDNHDDSISSFNAMVIDTAQRKQAIVVFRWDGSKYCRGDTIKKTDEVLWEDFRPNRLRSRAGFELSDSTRRRLEDPGVNIQHSTAGPVLLSQIFVFPDLRRTISKDEDEPSSHGDIIKGEKLVEFVSGATGIHLITGDGQSGKTALCKMLMLRLANKGDVPILLNGSELPSPEKVDKFIENAFAAQYDSSDREAFRQLSATRRIFIIDDYHRLNSAPSRKDRLLAALSSHATRILLVAHDVMLGAEELARPDASAWLARYRIQPLGHLRRSQLVEQWLTLGDDGPTEALSFAKNLAEITRIINGLIGKNFVPAYPAYVLAVLQATDAATPIDTKASAHAYFYELFIRTSLARGRTSVQYDILMAYLAHVAHWMFVQKASIIGAAKLREIHTSYEQSHDLRLSLEVLKNELVDQGIWECRDDEFGFKYRYIYYYFCAAYLRDHINNESTRELIRNMSRSLHVEEHANIMLFLAHLSRDSIIISEMIDAARRIYDNVIPVQLDTDVAFLSELSALDKSIVTYRESDPFKERMADLEEMDRDEESEPSDEVTSASAADPNDPIIKLGMALKTLQILGQIAKNFPGSLEGSTKADIVGECYNLGLKALNSIYDMVRADKVQILQDFADLVMRHHRKFPRDKVLDRARDAVVALCAIAAFGTIKRISMAVGSPTLEATYERVSDKKIPAHRLIGLSIELDHAGVFPVASLRTIVSDLKKFPMVMWIARALATQHFRIFPVELSTKQRVCEILSIRYEQIEPTSEPLKLLRGRR